MDIDKIKSDCIKEKQTELVKYYISQLTPENIEEKIKGSIFIGNMDKHTIISHSNYGIIDMNKLVSTSLCELNIDREQLNYKNYNLSIVDILQMLLPSDYQVNYRYGRTTWSDCHIIEV